MRKGQNSETNQIVTAWGLMHHSKAVMNVFNDSSGNYAKGTLFKNAFSTSLSTEAPAPLSRRKAVRATLFLNFFFFRK
jgi:hypothetical protein